MKKIILLGAFGAILAGGYSILWYKNAENLKKEVEEGITAINTKMGENTFTYTSIDSSGIPGNITTNVKDAKFQFADMVKVYADPLELTSVLFSNSIRIGLENYSVLIDPSLWQIKPLHLQYKGNKDTYAEITFKEDQKMNFLTGNMSLNPTQNKEWNWKDVLEQIQSYSQKSSGGQILNKDTGDVLISSGPSSFLLNIERIDPISHNINLHITGKDSEINPKLDKLFYNILKQVEIFLKIDLGNLTSLDFSEQGKTNLELEMSYTGRTDFTDLNLENWNSHLAISKYNISNRLRSDTLVGSFFVKSKEKFNSVDGIKANPTFEGGLDIKGSLITAPEFSEYLKNFYIKTAKSSLAKLPKDQQESFFAQFFIKHADQILPDFVALGEIKYGLNFKIDTDNYSFLLNEYTIALAKYALSVNGNANFDPTKVDGNFEISITNYEQFVSDLIDYVSTINQMMKEESQGLIAINLGLNVKKNLINLLKKNSATPEGDSKDLILKIYFDKNKVKIGTMDSNQVLPEFMKALVS